MKFMMAFSMLCERTNEMRKGHNKFLTGGHEIRKVRGNYEAALNSRGTMSLDTILRASKNFLKWG